MRNLLLILKNGMRRSGILFPGVLIVVALLMVAYQGGRTAGEIYAVEKVRVGVMDLDNSIVSADMLSYMEEKLAFQVVMPKEGLSQEEAFDEMTGKLLDCKIAVIIEIPKGMQKELLAGAIPQLEMTILDDYENEAYTKSYLEGYMQRTALLAQAAGQDTVKLAELLKEAAQEQVAISLKEGVQQDMKKIKDENGLAMMLGFFTFVGYGYSMYMGMLLLEDKKNGTFKRIQVSSVKPAAYIGGMSLGNFLISLLVVAGLVIMLAVSGLESNTGYFLIALLMSLYLLFCIGFSFLAAFLVNSSFSFMTLGVAYIAIGNILGGAYFPLGENVLSKFSILTPQYFMMNVVRGLAENPAYSYGTDICILILMVVLVYLSAAVVFTRREK